MRGREPWEFDERKFFEPAEQAQLRQHVRQARRRTTARGPWLDWFLIELAFQTELRVSELAALECGDLYPHARRPGVLVRLGKGGRMRYVRINRYCCRAIDRFFAWRRATGIAVGADSPVFCSADGKRSISVRALQKRFARLLDDTGICGHSLHHCRHTYATNLYLASGGDLRLVQKQLGHRKITTTQIYADVFDESMQAAVERLYRPTRNGQGSP